MNHDPNHRSWLDGNTDLFVTKNVFVAVNSLTRSASARVACGIMIDRFLQRPSAHNIYGQTWKLNPIDDPQQLIAATGKIAGSTEVLCRWRQTKTKPLTCLCDCRALEVRSFYARPQNCEKRPLSSSCFCVCLSDSASVRPHGRTRVPLSGFAWHLIFEYFSKIVKVWDNVEKYRRVGQDTDGNVCHAHCMLDTSGCKFTLRICSTYCFSTAASKRLNDKLYAAIVLLMMGANSTRNM
jgi:hypothetical protein